MSEIERLTLMPDVGDVLNDPLMPNILSDIEELAYYKFIAVILVGYIHPLVRQFPQLFGGIQEREGYAPIAAAEEEGVAYQIPTGRGGKPFKSLSPPPTLLVARLEYEDDRIDEESLEHWLNVASSPSLLLRLDEYSTAAALAYFCSLVRNLPPHCHLLLFIDIEFHLETDEQKIVKSQVNIVDALLKSRCHLDFLWFTTPELAYKLEGRCCALQLLLSGRHLESGHAAFSMLSKLQMSSPDCKLSELFLTYDGIDRDEDSEDHYMIGISRALNELAEGCKLKRLDMRCLPSLGPQSMSLLVASIASPSCPILDLGISIKTGYHAAEPQSIAGFSILAQAFQSGSSLSKLKALRFLIDTNEAAACVVEILTAPPSNCKVRLLDIVIFDYHSDEPFFKKL